MSGLVHHFLEQSADQYGAKTALVCGAQRLTYLQVEQQANQAANALRARGIQRGDRVALFMPNSAELVCALFAVLKAGAVFVIINPTTKTDKLAYILNNCQARALISGVAQSTAANAMRSLVPSLTLSVTVGPGSETLLAYADFLAEGAPARPQVNLIDLDLACLIYTSGSTGEPKGVMSDHSNVVFAANSIRSYIGNTPDDIILDVLPLSFDYGLYQVFMAFASGASLVLEKGFTFPAAVLETIDREKVTGFPGVPTIFSLLVSMDLSRYDLSSLRYMTNTAAALPPAHILAIRKTFPSVTLFSMYGLTETKRTLYLPPDQLDIRPDSVGIAIPGTEVWIENESGERLAPGETGELVVRGRHVMRGYWADAERTAQRYRPGPIPGERLCYTGDLFRMDADGYFYFVGRKDDIIKSRGEKISPKEVENVLYRLEGVREAAVVGIPDEVLGQAVKIFIVPVNGVLTVTDVLRFCKANLEDYMQPKAVELVAELPKTNTGKIKKTDLH
jgi:amino acid adenylation domain-containing protein